MKGRVNMKNELEKEMRRLLKKLDPLSGQQVITDDKERDDIYNRIATIQKMIQIERDYELKQSDAKKLNIDWNLILNGAISMASVLMVLNYEKDNIITTKSWSIASKWIGKGK